MKQKNTFASTMWKSAVSHMNNLFFSVLFTAKFFVIQTLKLHQMCILGKIL